MNVDLPSSPSRGQGFTLVELAIVMAIIGLLIGGVLKAEEMINQARVTRTVKHIQESTAAVAAFRDKYGQFPGDMANATQRLTGCGGMTAAGNWCQNGNSDGHIGLGPSVFSGSGVGISIIVSEAGVDHPKSLETTEAWKHLALTDLIAGVSPSAHPLTDLAWGITHPASPFTGGMQLQHHPKPSFLGQGLALVFRDNMTGPVGHGNFDPEACVTAAIPTGDLYQILGCMVVPEGFSLSGEYIVRPSLMLAIDRKADDGDPVKGFVRGFCMLGPQGMASTSHDCFFWANIH